MNRLTITCIFILNITFAFSQNVEKSSSVNNFIINPEFMGGVISDPNSEFPDHGFQKQLFVNFGWEQDSNPQEWAQRLKGPRIGFSIGYSNFGNADKLGSAYSFLPYIEFNAFKMQRLKLLVGMGGSYFTKEYDPDTNKDNQAITTDFTWTFRTHMYYQFLNDNPLNWRIGLGYFHHSNGHAQLPNQGYNAFLLSVGADITSKSYHSIQSNLQPTGLDKSRYNYYALRAGYGQNVLSKSFNDKRPVYTFSGEYGRVYNNTYKLGIGLYYNFYQSYYDYINHNESLVQDGREFESLKENPWWNASNLGISLNGELLLSHIGIDMRVGFNFHKPAYQIDWRINQGWSYVPKEIPEDSGIVLGEFDSYYKTKKLISVRLGLKYYLINSLKKPKNNLYIGAHLNSNLGQADFSEIGLGYVHNFIFD